MTEMELKLLVDKLFEKAPVDERCEHIRKDSQGPYCAKDLKKGMPIDYRIRRVICDPVSLKMLCLDKERCNKCQAYQEGLKGF